jgi:peptidoglycan/LPS O-acetylase OafA/YrhL
MNRLPGLDLLRAIAILWVMYYHALVLGLSAPNDVARFGWMGVDLFFALSGFLIGGQLFKPAALGRKLEPGAFYARRLFRTLPAYLVVLALYFAVPMFRERPGLGPLWQYLTFTQNLFVDFYRAKAFSHVWSLCVEEQFYLVAPLIVMLLAWKPSPAKAIAALLFFFVGGMALRGYIWLYDLAPIKRIDVGPASFGVRWMEWIYYPTWTRLDGLLAGLTLALVRAFRPSYWQALTQYGNTLLGTGLLCIAIAMVLFQNQTDFLPSVFGYPLLSLGMGCLVAAGASGSSLIGRRTIPGASFFAAMAYSLYLTHKGIYHVVQLALGGRLDAYPPAEFVVFVGAAIAGGALLYFAVERPFLRLRDRLFDKRKADADYALAIETG